MRSGDNGGENSGDDTRGRREGTRTTLIAWVNDLLAPEDISEDAPKDAPTIPAASDDGAPVAPAAPSPRSARAAAPWIVAVAGVVLLSTLLLMFADTARRATTTPLPALGYQWFTDHTDGFTLQYPVGWVSKSNTPGAEFLDNEASPVYWMQVLLPGSATSAGPTTDPNDAGVWVNYELDNLSRQVLPENFQRLPDSAGAMTLAGEQWRHGAALISTSIATGTITAGTATTSTTRIRVEVYATLHDGKPYIINLLAPDEQFSAGVTTYFTPMLQSFAFLTPPA